MANPYPHVLYQDDSQNKWQGDPDVAITGSGFSVPRGIEAIFSYNGLVMNDLTVYDKYRVMSIDGLGDGEVRDNREETPGDDGEDAFDSYYAGRTIVMTVRVEAYTLNKLRDMEEALRSAFVDMVEKPLQFLTGDPEKDHYIMCKKSADLTKEEDVSSLDWRHFREWQITLRASDPRFYRSKPKFLTSLVTISNTELNTASGFEDSSVVGYSLTGAGTLTSGVVASGVSGWSSPPGTKSLKVDQAHASGGNSYIKKNFTVQGGVNYMAEGDIKFVASPPGLLYGGADIYTLVYFYDVNGNVVSYIASPVKSVGTLSFSETWHYSFAGVAPAQAVSAQLRIGVNYNFPYTIYMDNLSFRHTYPYSITKQANIVNIGNYKTDPVIKLVGRMNGPILWNDNAPEPFNSIKFKPGVTIANGDYYVIDIKKKTVVNSAGQNKIADLDMTSGWMKLYPGNNVIYLDDSVTFSGSTTSQFTLDWKDAWM